MTSNLPDRRTTQNAPASPEAPFCTTFHNGPEAGRLVCFNLGKAASAARKSVLTLEGFLARATAADVPTNLDLQRARQVDRNLAESRLAEMAVERLITSCIPPNRRCPTCPLSGEIIDGTASDESEAGGNTPAIQATPHTSGIIEA